MGLRIHCPCTAARGPAVMLLAVLGAPVLALAQHPIEHLAPVGGYTYGPAVPAAVSADGRFVVLFTATPLDPADADGDVDVYVRDRQAGTWERLPLPSMLQALPPGAERGLHQVEISDDGQVVAYSAYSRNIGGLYVHDRVSGVTRRGDVGTGGIAPDATWPLEFALSGNGRFLAFRSPATILVPPNATSCGPAAPYYLCTNVFHRDLQQDTTRRLSVGHDGTPASSSSYRPSISTDGRFVAFSSDASNLVTEDTNGVQDVFVADTVTGRIERVSRASGPAGSGAQGNLTSFNASISGDGAYVAFLSQATNLTPGREAPGCVSTAGVPFAAVCVQLFVHHRAHGTTRRIDLPQAGGFPVADRSMRLDAYAALSYDGRHLAFSSLAGNLVPGDTNGIADVFLHDQVTRITIRVSMRADGGEIAGSVQGRYSRDPRVSGDGRVVLFWTDAPGVVAGDTNSTDDLFLVALDADGDGMQDAWERLMGLDPTSDDAAGDADEDGRTNLQEHADGTHPRAQWARYFAEGVTAPPFSTRLDLFNPGATPVSVITRLDTASRRQVSRVLVLGPLGRTTLDLRQAVPDLDGEEFAITVEADGPVAAERTVDWGKDRHADSGAEAASPTWYFAEGATHSGFQLFFLLQNPNDEAASVEATFLRPHPAPPVSRTYLVEAHARRTVWVNVDDPQLAATDVGARFESSLPIVAERAMYRDAPGTPGFGSGEGGSIGAGHAAGGAPQPLTRWYFAEGATGEFFDLFLLLGAPTAADVEVQVRYLLDDGTQLVRRYAVAGLTRRTVWVDLEDPRLQAVAVGMLVESVNGEPFVAERAMWWPGPTPATWYAAHASLGGAATGPRWAVAGGWFVPAHAETYVLLTNPASVAVEATLTLSREGVLPITRALQLLPGSRTTVPVGEFFGLAAAEGFSVLVETAGSGSADIIVERASYEDAAAGRRWQAGVSALATRLP